MLRRLGLLFAALALFALAGGHWAVLQSVAWAEMLRDYTQRTGSVAAAVQQTFDGQHPCGLCQQIASAKQQEQAKAPASTPADEKSAQAEKSPKATTLDLLAFVGDPQQGISLGAPPTHGRLLPREDQPPTPPPRAAREV